MVLSKLLSLVSLVALSILYAESPAAKIHQLCSPLQPIMALPKSPLPFLGWVHSNFPTVLSSHTVQYCASLTTAGDFSGLAVWEESLCRDFSSGFQICQDSGATDSRGH